MNTKNKNNYFLTFCKKGRLIFSLFICSLVLLITVFGFEKGLFATIEKTKSWKVFLLLCLSVYLALIFIYAIVSIKQKVINASDCCLFSLALSSLLFALYLFLIAKKFNVVFLIGLGVIFLLSTLLLIIKSVLYANLVTEQNYQENAYQSKILSYYKSLFSKFSFLKIVSLSVIILSLCMMFVCPSLKEYFSLFKLKNKIATILVCLVLPAVYVILKLSSKHVSGIDAILLACNIALPLIFAYIYLTHKFNKEMFVWTATFSVTILFTIIRLMCFEFSDIEKEKSYLSKNALFGYVKSMEKDCGFTSAIALGSLWAVAFNHVYTPSHLYLWITQITTKGIIPHPAVFPILILFTAIYLSLGITGLFSLLVIKSKKVCFGDFSTLALASFSIFSLVCVTQSFSYARTTVAIVCLIYAFSIIGARINNTKEKTDFK